MGFMVKLRKALVVLPGDVPDEVALVRSSHGYAIYLGESEAGSPTFVSAELGVPRAIQDQVQVGADLVRTQRTGEQPDHRALRTYCSGAGAARRGRDLIGHPSARVAVSQSSGQLGVRVWKPTAGPAEVAKARGVVKIRGEVDEAFRQTFAQVLAETFLGAIWPVPAPNTEALQDYDTLSRAAEYVLEPETLLLKGINAAARAAAHAATFGLFAPLVGKLAENACAPLLRPSAERQAATDVVKFIDIDLYAENDQVAECPTLHDIAAEQVANVIDNSLKAPPGTPIERVSLISPPRGPTGRMAPEPLSPTSKGASPQPGNGPTNRGTPQPAPPRSRADPWPGRRTNAPRRKPPRTQPPEQGQGRPSPGSGR
jgi:hypothetical protein